MDKNILVAGFFLFLLITGCTFKKQYEKIPPRMPEVKKIVSVAKPGSDWEIHSLDGETVRLSDYAGKVVFLNLWATWCQPCLLELPGIQHLYNAMKDSQVTFLFISDEEDSVLKEFIEKTGYTIPVYHTGKEIPTLFQTGGYPVTFILDQNGAAVFKHVGSAKWNDPSVIRFLQELSKNADR